SLKDGFIYMHLIGVKHAEELFLVFTEPVTHKIGHSLGVCAAISMDKKPYAGKFMLSSVKLTNEMALDLMDPDQAIVTEELPLPEPPKKT
ncbi:MAG: hypothetical protein MIO92_10045, partial [Methanosarcinaceae archaeon]|nr:hypothetical protein [Methanosarcinaceae archaeon]